MTRNSPGDSLRWWSTAYHAIGARSALLVIASSMLAPGWQASAQALPADLTPFVRVLYKETGQDPGYKSWGSGTIVTARGLVLTNRHVFDVPDSVARRAGIDPSVIYIGFDDDRNRHTPPRVLYRASRLAYWYSGFRGEPDYDVAAMLITHHADGRRLTNRTFGFVRLGNPFALPDAAEIHMLGYPGLGGDNLVHTIGHFSSFMERQGDSEIPDGALFINGDVWPGNSGGAALYRDARTQSWKLIGLPTRAGPGSAIVYPITWAVPLLRFVSIRSGIDVPTIPSSWMRHVKNRDPWTRERSTVMGVVVDTAGRPVKDARVWIYPARHGFGEVQSHARRVNRVPYVDVHDDAIYYAVAQTDDTGFFESWIEADDRFAMRIVKSGYRMYASDSWRPGGGVAQRFEDNFVMTPNPGTITNIFTCNTFLRQAIRYYYSPLFTRRSAGSIARGTLITVSRRLGDFVRVSWLRRNVLVSPPKLEFKYGWVRLGSIPAMPTCQRLQR